MDSLTQIVLGASVAEASLGKKVGNKAMLWGAIAGTIPDLDVITRHFFDPITANLMHRGFTHSLLFSLIAAPIFAWCVRKSPKWSLIAFLGFMVFFFLLSNQSVTAITIVSLIFLGLSFLAYRFSNRVEGVTTWDWTKLFFLSLVTHPLLDAHTDWGTQFFWPFEYRLAYKNIFVADPLYTLPFLILVLIALFHKRMNPRRSKWNNAALIVSSSYMVLTIIFKFIAFSHFEDELDRQGIEYVEMDTRPTPLNSILWNAQVETKNGFIVGYYSILDSKSEVEFSNEYPKNHHVVDSLENPYVLGQLKEFTAGWYKFHYLGDSVMMTDIRFGQLGVQPNKSQFVWQYYVYVDSTGVVRAEQHRGSIGRTEMADGLGQLWRRMLGN